VFPRGKPRPQRHGFAFTGLIRCGECGYCITAEHRRKVNKGDGRVHHYTYYHCSKRSTRVSCAQPHIEVRALERQIAAYLARIRIPQAFTDWAIRYLREANA
jgi:site-specific DNA recombinase